MIKANELKVGNWVTITGQSIKLTGPKLSFIFDEDGLITRCEPILLTPEILEKCGFGVRNVNMFYKRGMGDSLIYHYDGFCVWEVNQKVIRYLHQLQNLYFALTGQELKINLNVEVIK